MKKQRQEGVWEWLVTHRIMSVGHGKGMNQHRTKGLIIMGIRSRETIEQTHRGKGVIRGIIASNHTRFYLP